jgi:hypothetical protein
MMGTSVSLITRSAVNRFQDCSAGMVLATFKLRKWETVKNVLNFLNQYFKENK